MDLAITRRFGTAAALISVLAFFATVAQAADFDDDPRRIVTQDEGQSHTRVASILSYLSVQRAIDRDGVHLNEDFSGTGLGVETFPHLRTSGAQILS